jgi:hypothetical protein
MSLVMARAPGRGGACFRCIRLAQRVSGEQTTQSLNYLSGIFKEKNLRLFALFPLSDYTHPHLGLMMVASRDSGAGSDQN